MKDTSKFLVLFYLLTITTLHFSCAQEKPSNTSTINPEKNQIDLTIPINKPTKRLDYPSGIRSILHDSKGHYWFGSHQEGVCLFDGKTFTYFTVDDGLSDNQIRRIQEGEDGQIWFGTGDGVSSYKNGVITNHTAQKIFATPGITKLNWKLTENDRWFNANEKSGVYRFDGQKAHYLSFASFNNKFTEYYGVTDFSKRKNGQLWIATYIALFGFVGKSLDIIDDELLGFSKETGRLHIRSVLEDSKGNVWIGNNGIGVLLKKNDSISNFSKEMGLVHSSSSRNGGTSPAGTLEHVFAIEEDQHGNIWFGDRDTGAWKYDGQTMTNYTRKDGLSCNFPQTIYKDNNDNLWFGLADGNVFQFNGKLFVQKYN